jgi:hypothetical protein
VYRWDYNLSKSLWQTLKYFTVSKPTIITTADTFLLDWMENALFTNINKRKHLKLMVRETIYKDINYKWWYISDLLTQFQLSVRRHKHSYISTTCKHPTCLTARTTFLFCPLFKYAPEFHSLWHQRHDEHDTPLHSSEIITQVAPHLQCSHHIYVPNQELLLPFGVILDVSTARNICCSPHPVLSELNIECSFISFILFIWFVRLLALRPLLAYCASLGQ